MGPCLKNVSQPWGSQSSWDLHGYGCSILFRHISAYKNFFCTEENSAGDVFFCCVVPFPGSWKRRWTNGGLDSSQRKHAESGFPLMASSCPIRFFSSGIFVVGKRFMMIHEKWLVLFLVQPFSRHIFWVITPTDHVIALILGERSGAKDVFSNEI